MDHQLIILRPPIPTADFQQVEDVIRKADILTCFDQSVDAASAIRFVSEGMRFGTATRALIDLNIFRDILSLGRADQGRNAGHRRLAAAIVLFFQAAEILVEPCMALYESPSNPTVELNLFRQIDNAEPEELLEIFHGKKSRVTLADLPESHLADPAFLKCLPHGTSLLEIALLKLATLLREPISNFKRMEQFLRWSSEDFLFVQEAVVLAFHQLAGNRPKPLLRGYSKLDPLQRLKGVENALWDTLLIREWTRRIESQSEKGEIWLLCSRDETLTSYARKLVVTGDEINDVEHAIKSMISSIWPTHEAKRITNLYHELIAATSDPARAFNRSGQNLDLESLRAELQERLKSPSSNP